MTQCHFLSCDLGSYSVDQLFLWLFIHILSLKLNKPRLLFSITKTELGIGLSTNTNKVKLSLGFWTPSRPYLVWKMHFKKLIVFAL